MSLLSLWDDLTAEASSAVNRIEGMATSDALTEVAKLMTGAVSPAAVQAQKLIDSAKAYAGMSTVKAVGLSTLPAESTEISELKARVSDVKRWGYTLDSMETTMLRKMSSPKLDEALRVWRGGFYTRSLSYLSDAIAQNERITAQVKQSDGNVNTREGQAYVDARRKALDEAASAVSYGQKIAQAIERDYAKAAQASKPTAAQFALAPVTGALDMAKTTVGIVGEGASSVRNFAAQAGAKLESVAGQVPTTLKYAAIGVAGFAALVLLGQAKAFLPNPPRRRRSRR